MKTKNGFESTPGLGTPGLGTSGLGTPCLGTPGLGSPSLCTPGWVPKSDAPVASSLDFPGLVPGKALSVYHAMTVEASKSLQSFYPPSAF